MLAVKKVNNFTYRKTTIENSREQTFTATMPKMIAAYKKAEMNPYAEAIQLNLLKKVLKFFNKFEKELPQEIPFYRFKLGERNIIPESLAKIEVNGATLQDVDDFLHEEGPIDNLGCCTKEILEGMKVGNPDFITLINKSYTVGLN